jgi:hypothetical protein
LRSRSKSSSRPTHCEYEWLRIFNHWVWLRKVRIAPPLCDYALKVVLTRKTEQFLTIDLDVVAVQEAFTSPWHDSTEPKLTVGQRQITSVLAVSKPSYLLLVIRARVLVPENVKGIKEWFGTTE